MGKRNNASCPGFHVLQNRRERTAKANSVKIRNFQGASTDGKKIFLQPYLKCSPTNIILHVGTNNSINDSSGIILNKLLLPKDFIQTELPGSNVILSNIIERLVNGIVRLKL